MKMAIMTRVLGAQKTRRCAIAIVVGAFLILGTSEMFSQGTDPGGVPAKPAKAKPKPKPKPKATPRPAPKPRTSTTSKPKRAARSVPVLGNLRISANLEGIEVTVLNSDGEAVETVPEFEENRQSAILLRDLGKGTYTVSVRKQGYFEATQSVVVEASKTKNIHFDLRPAMASVSIETNVSDASVFILDSQENRSASFIIADSNNRLFQLVPGSYTLTVSKRGFKPENKVVTLDTPGQHLTFVVPLKAFTNSELLDYAETAFRSGDYESVVEYCDIALENDRYEGKANRLTGLAYFYMGDSRSAAHLAHAIRRHEAFSIPVVLYDKSYGNMLVAGDLTFSSTSIEFKSRIEGKASFTFTNKDTKDLRKLNDGNAQPYVILRGKGVFDGKRKTNEVRLYSHNAALTSSRDRIFCTGCAQSTCKCPMDISTLYDALFAWRYQ